MGAAKKCSFRLLALFVLLWTLTVLVTEATLIYDPSYTLPNFIVNQQHNTGVTFVFSVFFLAGITMCCFFSIFNLKFSDYLQLKAEQTDCIQMASVTGLCSKIVNVIVYNYMVVCGEIQRGVPFADQQFSTGFVRFYSSMIRIKFFRDYYNIIAPLMILVFGLLFASLGVFKYHSKNLEAFILFAQGRESGKETKESKQDRQLQKNKPFSEKVLLGEKAILKEYQSMKTKFERRRMSMFGAGGGVSFGALLGSFSG